MGFRSDIKRVVKALWRDASVADPPSSDDNVGILQNIRYIKNSIASRLDTNINSRASSNALATVDGVVDAIKALLDNDNTEASDADGSIGSQIAYLAENPPQRIESIQRGYRARGGVSTIATVATSRSKIAHLGKAFSLTFPNIITLNDFVKHGDLFYYIRSNTLTVQDRSGNIISTTTIPSTFIRSISRDDQYIYLLRPPTQVYVFEIREGQPFLRQTAREFSLHSDNGSPLVIRVYGGYAYVLDTSDTKIYVYELTSSGANYVSSREFDIDNSYISSGSTFTIYDGYVYIGISNQQSVRVYELTSSGATYRSDLDHSLYSNPSSLQSGEEGVYVLANGSIRFYQATSGHILQEAEDDPESGVQLISATQVKHIGNSGFEVTEWSA